MQTGDNGPVICSAGKRQLMTAYSCLSNPVIRTRLQVQLKKHGALLSFWAHGRKSRPPATRVVVDSNGSLLFFVSPYVY
jgi:hypothetical protein